MPEGRERDRPAAGDPAARLDGARCLTSAGPADIDRIQFRLHGDAP